MIHSQACAVQASDGGSGGSGSGDPWQNPAPRPGVPICQVLDHATITFASKPAWLYRHLVQGLNAELQESQPFAIRIAGGGL